MITITFKNDDSTQFATVDIPLTNAQRNALLDWWRAQPGNLKPPIDIDTPQEQYGRPAAARRLSRQMVRSLFNERHEAIKTSLVETAVAAARSQAIAAAGQPIGVPEETN